MNDDDKERETPSEAEARAALLDAMDGAPPPNAHNEALVAAYRAAVLRAEREETVGLVERLRERLVHGIRCRWPWECTCGGDSLRSDADAWLAKRKGGA